MRKNFTIDDLQYEQITDNTVRVASCKNKNLTSIAIPNQITVKGFLGFNPKTYKVTDISISAFKDCTNLKKVVLAEGITEISYFAFEGCTALTEVSLPSSLTYIRGNAFKDCKNLTNIKIPETTQHIGKNVFEGDDTLLYSENNLLLYKDGSICFGLADKKNCPSEIVIPDSVKIIAAEAFLNCNKLKKVTFSKILTIIGDEAFRYCENLTELICPPQLEEIGMAAFEQCYGLTKVVFSETLITIGEDAFFQCPKISGIRLPDSVVDIGYMGLDECSPYCSWEVHISPNHPLREELEYLDDRLVVDDDEDDYDWDDEGLAKLKAKSEQGDAKAQDELGYYYWMEEDDAEQAFYWYKKAAEQEYPTAMADLGRCYTGAYDDAQIDYSKAIQLFTKAANLGCGNGYYGLSECYANGWGVEKNLEKAKEYFAKAMELGCESDEPPYEEED